MDQINEKFDRILSILELLASDVQNTKKNALKMSDHIDTVEYYVRLFDCKFRTEKQPISSNLAVLENTSSLD